MSCPASFGVPSPAPLLPSLPLAAAHRLCAAVFGRSFFFLVALTSANSSFSWSRFMLLSVTRRGQGPGYGRKPPARGKGFSCSCFLPAPARSPSRWLRWPDDFRVGQVLHADPEGAGQALDGYPGR